MKLKDICFRVKKGYYRPTTLPLWKLVIIYCVWIVSVSFYISAAICSMWLVLLGMLFQSIAMFLPIKWDTGSWKETEQGKNYIEKYERDRI